jgi:hypothetical protein
MPVNLNALIRYKVIDTCLCNKQNSCDINFLIKKCSFALSESTGTTTSVSERTIRNDIRILRSDILGFNAPITVNNGIYMYSVDKFSIFNTAFNELELLIEIQNLLVDEIETIKNKNVKYLLNKLATITKIPLPKNIEIKQGKSNPPIFEKRIIRYTDFETILNTYILKDRTPSRKYFFSKLTKNEYFNWRFIFMIINKTAQ